MDDIAVAVAHACTTCACVDTKSFLWRCERGLQLALQDAVGRVSRNKDFIVVALLYNVLVEADGPTWSQASLPVKFSGIGVRSTVQLSSSAFLTSSISSVDLVVTLLARFFHLISGSFLFLSWHELELNSPKTMMNYLLQLLPLTAKRCVIFVGWLSLLVGYLRPFLMTSLKHKLFWQLLQKISSLSLCMDEDTLQIGVGLR